MGSLQAPSGVSFTTVTDAGKGSVDYRLAMDLPAGARIAPTSDGGFLAVGADGLSLGWMGAPWALDVHGRQVPVSYKLDGTTVVMHPEAAGLHPDLVPQVWWNPFSWDWETVGKKCFKGMTVAILGTATTAVITNIARAAGGLARGMVLGVWGYVAVGAGGCVIALVQ